MYKIPYFFLISLLIFCSHRLSLAETDPFFLLHKKMVDTQIISRGITDQRVIMAMKKVPRHLFVPESMKNSAYSDSPLPIGNGQTISQPFIVAFMTQVLELSPGDRVLEIGTGSGYQAAILAELVSEVYTIEIRPSLAESAHERLKKMGYENIFVRTGDGYKGWPEKAPFHSVIVTCAPEKIPQALIDQLAEGGRMVIPVGQEWGSQKLILIRKRKEGVTTKSVMDVMFVPMVKEKEIREK